jgi:hypothetical protein
MLLAIKAMLCRQKRPPLSHEANQAHFRSTSEKLELWLSTKARKPRRAATIFLTQLPPQSLKTMAPHDDHGHAYHPKDAIGESSRAGFKTGIVGAMFSGIQATLTKQNIGAFGAVTKYGGTMAMFGTQRCSCVVCSLALTIYPHLQLLREPPILSFVMFRQT